MKGRQLHMTVQMGGREVRAMAVSHRRILTILALLLLACAGAALALALTAAPASAFTSWQHDGATHCTSCHWGMPVTDTQCVGCHTGFKSVPGNTCWTCHAPGEDTSSLASPSSACSQGCHLYDPSRKGYVTPFTHGTEPHPGATGFGFECLDCHTTSSGGSVNGSPHHIGVDTPAPTCRDCHNGVIASAQVTHDGVACTSCHDGMNIPAVPAACNSCHIQKTFGTGNCTACHATMVHNTSPNVGACTSCHAGYRKHAGSVGCTRCHTNAPAFHHGTATMKAKKCGSCHSKTHAGRAVAVSKCTACHKGNAPASKPRVQHSSSITKKYVCSTCHSKALHASARGAHLTCRSCHATRFHARQPRPGNSVCLRCHSRARYHAVGFACSVCHRSAIHDATPNVLPVRLGA